jgi:4-amino-4-deoxy-L-arabinose transferase-like glycosyltransferase
MSNLTISQLIGIIFAGVCLLFLIFGYFSTNLKTVNYGFAFFLGLGALVIGLSKSPTKL